MKLEQRQILYYLTLIITETFILYFFMKNLLGFKQITQMYSIFKIVFSKTIISFLTNREIWGLKVFDIDNVKIFKSIINLNQQIVINFIIKILATIYIVCNLSFISKINSNVRQYNVLDCFFIICFCKMIKDLFVHKYKQERFLFRRFSFKQISNAFKKIVLKRNLLIYLLVSIIVGLLVNFNQPKISINFLQKQSSLV